MLYYLHFLSLILSRSLFDAETYIVLFPICPLSPTWIIPNKIFLDLYKKSLASTQNSLQIFTERDRKYYQQHLQWCFDGFQSQKEKSVKLFFRNLSSLCTLSRFIWKHLLVVCHRNLSIFISSVVMFIRSALDAPCKQM